jgi:hypothetical protein
MDRPASYRKDTEEFIPEGGGGTLGLYLHSHMRLNGVTLN